MWADGITLSSRNLFNSGRVTAPVAVTAAGIAYFAAVAFKLGAVLVVGGRSLMKHCPPALLAPAIGVAIGLPLFT